MVISSACGFVLAGSKKE